MSDSTQEEFLNIAELAALLKKPEASIYGWRTRGYGPPAVQIGRSLLWRRSDVIAWFEGQLAAVTAKQSAVDVSGRREHSAA